MKAFRPLIGCLLALCCAGAAASDKTIAVTYFVEHPVVSDVIRGFKESLRAEGIEEGKGVNFLMQSAQGSPVTAAQIARQLAGAPIDLVFVLSTPSSQAIATAIKDKPIVFAGVTDPVAARLVANLTRPGGNITGSRDAPPIEQVARLITDFVPTAKSVGVVYNAGEANSKAQVEQFKRAAKSLGLEVVEATVSKPSDVQTAAQSLDGKVQAIFCPNDSTVVSNFEVLNRVQTDTGIPVFASDVSNVRRGALAGVGVSFYQGGVNAGRIAAAILKRGEKPGDIPVAIPETFDTAVNEKTRSALKIAVPEVVRKSAQFVGH